jgi:hypothetical protein
MNKFPLSQTGLARNRGVMEAAAPCEAPPIGRRLQERIQILHRAGVAPKMNGVFELEVYALGAETQICRGDSAGASTEYKDQTSGRLASPMLE